jgi:hypothetical protein
LTLAAKLVTPARVDDCISGYKNNHRVDIVLTLDVDLKAVLVAGMVAKLKALKGARTRKIQSRAQRERPASLPAPKEQPPRNLSGKRTTAQA